MAAVAEAAAPHDSGSLNQNEGPSPDDAVIFFGISLLLGIASRHLLNGTRVPYTVALLILGIGLGSIGMNNLSFCHAASGYQVETRARVIFFDLAVPETEASLSKRSTSWISLPGQPQRTLSKEHVGLLSWPENLFKGRGDHQNPKESAKQTTSLSANGSLANIPSSYCRNDLMGSSVNRSHSLSYPRLPLRSANDTRTLVSVQPESTSLKNRLAPAGSASRLGTDPPLTIRKDGEDNSSDESGGEEVIIRIDSLSNLFFCQTSETSNAQNR